MVRISQRAAREDQSVEMCHDENKAYCRRRPVDKVPMLKVHRRDAPKADRGGRIRYNCIGFLNIISGTHW